MKSNNNKDFSALNILNTPAGRGVYCNRTLNLRSVAAIGYDMDYTLIHYHVEEWERRAYEHLQSRLIERGWPIDNLRYDGDMTVRGLVLDLELGNVVKTNRFGYVKNAAHGTNALSYEDLRDTYSQVVVDLSDERFVFVNTLFSKSEVSMFSQLVDLLDQKKLSNIMSYVELYRAVKRDLDATHMEGELKAEILADPDRFVDLDPETPLALLDQKNAGKKLLLITNSEWNYTSAIMSYAFDRFLPDGTTWRDLFDVIIVSARKPLFFTARNPLFEVVNEEGLLKPLVSGLEEGKIFLGGSASLVEELLNVAPEKILYVGDHLFADVHVSKNVLRWRTALIVRELEAELVAIEAFKDKQKALIEYMKEKEALEAKQRGLRLFLVRRQKNYGDKGKMKTDELHQSLGQLKEKLVKLDEMIAPLAKDANEISNARWGLLMRSGNDKSLFARGVEKSADIYLSRVSNFLYLTPFAYLRSSAGSLPHDSNISD